MAGVGTKQAAPVCCPGRTAHGRQTETLNRGWPLLPTTRSVCSRKCLGPPPLPRSPGTPANAVGCLHKLGCVAAREGGGMREHQLSHGQAQWQAGHPRSHSGAACSREFWGAQLQLQQAHFLALAALAVPRADT